MRRMVSVRLLANKLNPGAPNASFRGISVRKASNRLRYSDSVAVKARDFFGEILPRTFVTRRLISSYCFRGDKYVV